MRDALAALARGEPVAGLVDFTQLRWIVGFDAYDTEWVRYGSDW